jgi:hypothetical protein
MEIAYELTQKDFTESFSAHRNRRPLVKWTRRIFVLLVLLVSLFLLSGSIKSGNTTVLFPFFGLVILWLAIIAALPSWSARRQFLKQPGARGGRTVVFDGTGAHWKWNEGSSDIEWKNYVRLVEGKNQILLYSSPACFNIIPKRAIGEAELSEVRNLLKQKIPPRK